MNHTTRRFPRSTLEAWPNRHPYAVEHYSRRTERALDLILACAIALGLAAALIAWWLE